MQYRSVYVHACNKISLEYASHIENRNLPPNDGKIVNKRRTKNTAESVHLDGIYFLSGNPTIYIIFG